MSQLSTIYFKVNIKEKRLLHTLLFLVLFVFISNKVAMNYDLFGIVWWFDMPMHFLGGIFLGFLVLFLILFRNFFYKKEMSLATLFLRCVVGVLFFSVGWEIFEKGIDTFITFKSFNLLDTASDIFFDLAGGISAFLYAIIFYFGLYTESLK